MLREKHVQILNTLSGNLVTNSEIFSLLYRAGTRKSICFFLRRSLINFMNVIVRCCRPVTKTRFGVLYILICYKRKHCTLTYVLWQKPLSNTRVLTSKAQVCVITSSSAENIFSKLRKFNFKYNFSETIFR